MISPYELQSRLLKSLAHPSRLKMIEELAAGDKCVTDLQISVGDHISTISKHLAVLRAAGIVETSKHGLQVFYRLRTPCVKSFLNCLQAASDPNRPDEQNRTVTLCAQPPKDLKRSAPSSLSSPSA